MILDFANLNSETAKIETMLVSLHGVTTKLLQKKKNFAKKHQRNVTLASPRNAITYPMQQPEKVLKSQTIALWL